METFKIFKLFFKHFKIVNVSEVKWILQNEINVLWLDFCSRILVLFFNCDIKLHILSIEAIKLKMCLKSIILCILEK